jgi:hypothetical protein
VDVVTIVMNGSKATHSEIAVERVVGFAQQFDRTHLDLACHAAFPQTLTPDLLYQIWLRFVPQAPWTAVARILLSRLCREVGYELYEMDIAVRNLLLKELKEDERFGKDRLEELADFLTSYVKQQLDGEEPNTRNLAQAQYWTALACTKPNQLSRELASAIESSLEQKNMRELFRLGSLVETFPELLAEFVPLIITYASGIARLASGDTRSAEELLSRLPTQKRYVEIAGINVPILDPVFLPAFGRGNSSLTLYAFHLRNSINQGLEPTVPEATRLWEQLVDLGNKLDIRELQNLPQQLISYQNNEYFSEAEDNQESEYRTLLPNQQASLDFQIIDQPDGFPLQGLLCPYRLHDTYAIDLTIYSEQSLSLAQLKYLNPQYLLLPSQMQASLGQTLMLFAQPLESQDNYQALADACVEQLLPETDTSELVNTGYLLGNPIFEYESRHKDPSKQLHILVWFKCQIMDTDDMDKVSELLLYLLWCRHKIQYVYHESRWCDRQLKQLYNRIEQHRNSFSQISQFPEQQRQFRQLLVELQEIDIEYAGYLGDLDNHENTIVINEQNYRAKLEKLGALPETELSMWQQFLDYVRNKLQRQIQADRSFLDPGRDRLQHLKGIIEESLTKDFANNHMPGIPAQLYKRLSEALSKCEQFENNLQLRSLFKGYALLSPWANSLPQANSTAQRVTLVIAFLLNQYRRDTKENVLVVLVRLLSDTIDPVDSRHQTLSELADELNIIFNSNQYKAVE